MSIPSDLEEFTAYVDAFHARRGFDDIAVTLGLIPHAADGDSVTMRMPLTEAISQATGMYSAPALFGAADITGSLLAMAAYSDGGHFPLAVQSSQNYLSNAKDEYVLATARMLRGGNTVAVVDVVVATAAGKLLMQSTVTYVLVDRALGK